MRVMPGRGGKHRRPSRIVAAGVLVVAATVAVVWMTLAGPSATARTGPVIDGHRYGGETLMLGLFFGVGPVAEQYPDLVLTRVDDTPENRKHLSGVIAEAERRGPGLLERFGAAAYSGDPEAIAEAATEAVNRLYLVVAMPSGSGGGVADDPIDALETVADASLPADLAESPLANGRPNIHPVIVRWAQKVAATLRPGQ